jgi:predicted permease
MNPSEYLELIIMAKELAGTNGQSFVAALFAYLILIHFVGSDLNRVQVWTISIIYSGYCALTILALYQNIDLVLDLVRQFKIQFPVKAASYFAGNVDPSYRGLVPIFFIFGWLASIGNMVYALSI